MKAPGPVAGSLGGAWQLRAACGEEDPELFYPEFRSERDELEREALLVCALCPVRAQCLSDELRYGELEQWGTRGGMTESDRRDLLRAQRRRVAVGVQGPAVADGPNGRRPSTAPAQRTALSQRQAVPA